MFYCEECGNPIPDNAKNCPICGAPVYNDIPLSHPSEVPVETLPVEKSHTLILAEKEVIVKKYQCSRLRSLNSSGYLTVTNKRLIYQGYATGSRVAKEVCLDSVSGLDCYYGKDINGRRLFTAILIGLVGLLALFLDFEACIALGFVGLCVSIILACMSFASCFYLSIYSSKASGTPIDIGGGPQTKFGNGSLYTLSSTPSNDTDLMLNELGAMIQDLQTMGDHAIEKWKE